MCLQPSLQLQLYVQVRIDTDEYKPLDQIINMRTFHFCSYISLPLSQALQQVHKYVEVAGMGADPPVHDPHECVAHFIIVFL